MTEHEVREVILNALQAVNDERPESERFVVDESTKLFGEGAPLDSLALVSVIVDVETVVADRSGAPISLADDRAMGRAESPFSDVRSLEAYVLELLAENR